MPEQGEPRLVGLDGPRPLPDALRARLETALGAPAMPVAVRESIEDALADSAPSPFASGLDAPRVLPAAMFERLVETIADEATPSRPVATGGALGTLVRAARRLPTTAWLASAAAVAVAVLAIGMLSPAPDHRSDVVAGAEGRSTTTATATEPFASPQSDAALEAAPPTTALTVPSATPQPSTADPSMAPKRTARSQSPATTVPPRSPSRASKSATRSAASEQSTGGSTTTSGAAASGGASAPAPGAAASRAGASAGSGQSPPFTGGSDSSADTKSAAATPSSNETIRVAVAGGDDRQERGFRAYLELLNRRGGVNGRTISTVAPGTPGAVATVNLGVEPLASTPSGPVLETLTADESALRGEVLSLASAAERQANLAVDAVYTGDVPPGVNALVVRGASGALRGPIADAFARALRAKGVLVTVVDADSAMPAADAVFLSLTTTEARRWLERGRAEGYVPRAVAGIWTLHDPSIEALLPASAKVLAPYALPAGEEAAAIRDATSVSAASLHGWMTAKALALALWRSGATTPSATSAALRDLVGADLRLIPPYQVRSGTRSRTPEAVLLDARDGTFVQLGGFRKDPR